MSENEIGKVVINSSTKLVNNIIPGETLSEIQSRVLADLRNAIIPSMGPAGSNTLILRGNSSADIVAEYSKDGNKIIKSIQYQYPIEMAIKSEIENATRRIEKEVGDGTSSIVVMSSSIFDALKHAKNQGKLSHNPYYTMRVLKEVVGKLSEEIRAAGRECTLDDIYNIAYISTNGNDEVASQLRDIYEEYGMNVFIDVSASTDENTYVKSYNGVTIEAGYSDPAMINNLDKGSCIIRSRKDCPIHVYHFAEPIDTPEQLAMFQTIIEENVMNPVFGEHKREIPTVILVPQICRDAEAYMRRIVQMLHQYDEAHYSQKPQLLIVTNYMGLDENYVDHISNLCGCTPIKKYIDDTIQKKDQEAGLAPTLKNVCEFYGTAEEVEADTTTTKFVNPDKMYDKDENGKILTDENGNFITSKTYDNIINFLKGQYNSQTAQGANAGVLGSLKRQLNAIQANMVELFIGGISISDRDSLRDLVEDAVLNTRSAAAHGVGYGTNTMGYTILKKWVKNRTESEEMTEYNAIVDILLTAYTGVIGAIYSTVYAKKETIDQIMADIIARDGMPMNMSNGEFDGKVLTSIESEPAILDTVAKIISIMATANQSLVQAPSLAVHY